jgi:hypothetical protein
MAPSNLLGALSIEVPQKLLLSSKLREDSPQHLSDPREHCHVTVTKL